MLKKGSSGSKMLSISLLEPIVFVGSSLEASPVLRGIVNIHTTQSYTLTRLYLKFNGVMKATYREVELKHKDHHKLVASERQFLYPAANTNGERSRTTKPLILEAGITRFAFEMPLPAGIPETMNGSQIGVHHNLTVCLDYRRPITTISQYMLPDQRLDLHDEVKREIILARMPDSGMLSGENQMPNIDSNKHFSNWCQYRITMEKKAVATGSQLPIKIEIAPTVEHLTLKHFFLQLIERRTITVIDALGRPQERTSHSVIFLHPPKDTTQQIIVPNTPIKGVWEGNCVYQIPNNDKVMTHSSQAYADFKVTHMLLVTIVVSVPHFKRRNMLQYFSSNSNNNNSRDSKTFSYQTPIDLVNGDVFQTWEMAKLPSYDNNPMTSEEIEKLTAHGLLSDSPPPTYEEAILYH
ncbi:hypothetical protein BDF20DRAFT_1000407 [Mycotypha africana]|uniref:uncharacterized protein n=1 Tax=Mycotypha africana TaxID=64632 RepID=UPI0023000A14|nr:uncharacterized protein BDF20DRAFT_1000407 [Mycotypha africana]KAI8982464.1 hypothetical protein BDF20DRAFT_1000407 [Mycotypha africana]